MMHTNSYALQQLRMVAKIGKLRKNMKPSKQKLKQRNPFVALAMNRKAGSHRKTNKQMRRKENTKYEQL
jgi:hypothetical protein